MTNLSPTSASHLPLPPLATQGGALPPPQGQAPTHTMPCSRYLRDIQAGDGSTRRETLERMTSDSAAACRARALAARTHDSAGEAAV